MTGPAGRMRRWRDALRIVVIVAAGMAGTGCAATAGPEAPSQTSAGIWQTPRDRLRGPDVRGEAAIVRLNKPALDALLRDAPAAPGASAVIVALPMPDGTFARFRVAESSILAPELAAAFPETRTYSGQGIDDPTATARFGWTATGFHAIVLGQAGSVYIDPYRPGDTEHYVTYRKADGPR